ncbi:cell wall-binding repeat-containing protein [Peptacetobacter hiranonis]|uniref:cell wall-binding repeat-containing protein n=1 Tax=Peptacetobacter hiranonis TaxID=89152 RepID=UPI002E77F645|nr:cell wall-binding repeat-containing protein [Peptacetobacter hiranonis]MEE0248503.1 cell wall-binding repeat-containing protein [Peptacetobacter hiranonis]
MKKQKLVAALMSIALGTSTVFSTVAFAEGTVLPNSGVEIGTTENKEVELPKGVELNWGDNTVYYNGKYYKKLQTQKDTQTQEEIQGALEAAYKDTNTTGTKEIYCKPNADVGKMTHGHVADDLIIHGNGAYVSSGERDLEIDTYKWSRATGAKDEVNGTFLEKDITVTVNNLNGIAAWGQRNTNWKITLNFENCKNMQRIYFTGTTGEIDINVNGCSFDASDDNVLKANKGTAIYSNADGSINVSNTTFKNIDVGLNLNHKMLGTQTVKIENCDFIDCGQGTKDTKTYAAPIRIVAQDGATSNLTVNKATFTYGEGVKSCNGDILLGDGRALKENEKDKKQGITTLAMENTNANVMVQNYDYYKDDGTIDSGKGETTTVKDTQIVKPNDNNHFEVEDDKPVNPPIYPIYPPTPSEPTKTEIIGDDRYETAAKIADKMGYYDTAILVNGDKSLSDGLSASSLAGKEKAPILLVKQNTIPKETLTRALKAKKIYIIGGTAAISKDVEKQLAGKEIVRVDGKNRVETSEKVAKLVGNYDEAFIVNGNTGEADAISVSSVAAKNQAPILLTNGKTSTHSKKTGVEYYVVGGDAVVSDSLVSKFDAERISGSDRYETNRAVIKEFYPNKNKYYYTKGDLLVDALAVSPLSKDNGVVLVSPKSDNSILKDKDLVQVGGMDFEINLK